MTRASPIAHTLGVSPRKKLGAIILLVVAAALPESVWLGGHAFVHHDHEDSAGHNHEAAEAAQIAELATVLVHRHAHDEDVPDHEHHLAPAPASREVSPRRCDSARAIAEAPPVTGGAAVGEFRIAPGAKRPAAGSGPPLLALLCTLQV